MSVSLYDISIASYLQTYAGMISCLDKGLSYCKEKGIDPEEIVNSRLHPDMNSFNFQVQAIVHHSIGALAAVKEGSYYPTAEVPPASYNDLQKLILGAQEKLRQAAPAEIDGRKGGEVVFRFKDFAIPFTVENFLLSFSLPNFYFHATTAYDILRMKGVPLGKVDYLGAMRSKG